MNPSNNPTIEKNDPEQMAKSQREVKNSQTNPIILVILIFLLIVQSAFIAFLTFKKSTNNQAQIENLQTNNQEIKPVVLGAKVIYLTGRAFKKTTLDSRLLEIKENDELSEADIIITDPDTKLIIEFDDGSLVRLDEATELTLEMLTPEKFLLSETTGQVFAKVHKDENHLFVVKAGDYEVKALGTAFSVAKDEAGVDVKVFESQVEVTKIDNNSEVNETIAVKKEEQWQEQTSQVIALKPEAKQDEFLAWSLEEEKLLEITPTPKVEALITSEAPKTTALSLQGHTEENGIKLTWTVTNLNTDKGIKVIKSLESNPSYPKDNAELLGGEQREYLWKLTDGQTWHFRVCQYNGEGQCKTYSNEITVTAESKSKSEESSSGVVSGLSLQVQKDGSVAKLKWSVDGYSAKGYKVVWSHNSDPTYPCREGDQYHYLSNPDQKEDNISDLSGKYHFRVCEYLGGKCGKYSNDVEMEF